MLPKDALELTGDGHSEIVDSEAVDVKVTGRGLHGVPYFVELVALILLISITAITTKYSFSVCYDEFLGKSSCFEVILP